MASRSGRKPGGKRRRFGSGRAFSLVELLAATAILTIILAVIFGITQQISTAWKKSSAKIEAFQAGRAAFDAMTRQISQATLNTYYDYYDSSGQRRTNTNSGTFVPASYGRYSDLHFISGKNLVGNQISHALFFQAPMGRVSDPDYERMEGLINACGYYVVYGKDPSVPAFFDDMNIPNKPEERARFRLMQFLQPSENLAVYDPALTGLQDWFTDPLAESSPPARVLAENILALIVLPRRSQSDDSNASSLTNDYEYDTRDNTFAAGLHQLPPVVEIVLVAMDEPSAKRVCVSDTAPDFGLGTLFRDVADLEQDLAALTDTLNSRKISHRIFRTKLAIRGAKWSDL